MALPSNFTGTVYPAQKSHIGPFKHPSTGALYAVFIDANDSALLIMAKSTDDGHNWTTVGNYTFSALRTKYPIETIWATYDTGTGKIFVAYQVHDGGSPANRNIRFSRFDVPTDDWEAIPDLLDSDDTIEVDEINDNGSRVSVCIVHRPSDDKITIIGQGPTDTVNSILFSRLYVYESTDLGDNWFNGYLIEGSTSSSYRMSGPSAVVGANNRIHVFYQVSDDLAHRSISSADSWDNPQYVNNVIGGTHYPFTEARSDGTNVWVCYRNSGDNIPYEASIVSQANPAISTTQAGARAAVVLSSVGGMGASLTQDGGKRHLLYSDATDRDIYYANSSSWGSDTLIEASTATKISSTYYTEEVGYAYEASGIEKYNVFSTGSNISVGTATEFEVANEVVMPRTVTVGTASESESAIAVLIDTSQATTVGAASETESALQITAVSSGTNISVNTASEIETANTINNSVGGNTSVNVITATETESGGTISTATSDNRIISVATASEVEVAERATVVASFAGTEPTWNSHVGPFAHGTALYLVLIDSDDSGLLAMQKSTDNGDNWATIGTFTIDALRDKWPIRSVWAVYFEAATSYIYVAFQVDEPTGGGKNIRFSRFNLDTDDWDDLSGLFVDNVIEVAELSDNGISKAVSLVVLSNGKLNLFGQGPVNNGYERVYYYSSTDNGATWSAGTNLFTMDGVSSRDFTGPSAVVGANDRTHVFAATDSTHINHRSISATGTLDTEVYKSNMTDAKYAFTEAKTDGTKVYVAFLNSGDNYRVHELSITSQANPTLVTTQASEKPGKKWASGPVATLTIDDSTGTRYLLYGDDLGGDLYWVSSDNWTVDNIIKRYDNVYYIDANYTSTEEIGYIYETSALTYSIFAPLYTINSGGVIETESVNNIPNSLVLSIGGVAESESVSAVTIDKSTTLSVVRAIELEFIESNIDINLSLTTANENEVARSANVAASKAITISGVAETESGAAVDNYQDISVTISGASESESVSVASTGTSVSVGVVGSSESESALAVDMDQDSSNTIAGVAESETVGSITIKIGVTGASESESVAAFNTDLDITVGVPTATESEVVSTTAVQSTITIGISGASETEITTGFEADTNISVSGVAETESIQTVGKATTATVGVGSVSEVEAISAIFSEAVASLTVGVAAESELVRSLNAATISISAATEIESLRSIGLFIPARNPLSTSGISLVAHEASIDSTNHDLSITAAPNNAATVVVDINTVEVALTDAKVEVD